jgi:pimeloyl-ACP methyl ester carboxylesterase
VPTVDLRGLSVHYQQAGRGEDLVMIHGLFSNLAFWYLSVVPALAADFRVTVYDLRGHGYSEMPPTGYTTAELAIDLRALLDHLRIERAHVVGHSYGGAVALQHAMKYPERTTTLTLADAYVPGLELPFPARTTRQWGAQVARLRRAGIEVPEDLPRVAVGFLEELTRLERPMAGARPRSPALVARWDGTSRLVRRWQQLMRTTSAPNDLRDSSGLTPQHIRSVTQPTLAIYGQHSTCRRTLRGLKQTIPNCRVVIVGGTGHSHPVVAPETFVRSLRRFVLGRNA